MKSSRHMRTPLPEAIPLILVARRESVDDQPCAATGRPDLAQARAGPGVFTPRARACWAAARKANGDNGGTSATRKSAVTKLR